MTDMADRHEPEAQQRKILEQMFASTTLTPFELMRNFPMATPRFNLARFLSHYEVFKRIVDVPGAIVDLGVYRGASTFTWAKLCEIFCPTDIRKTIFGFDTFEGFPNVSPEDGPCNIKQDVMAGGYFGGTTVERDLDLARMAMNCDRHLSHIERIEFIKGDACHTIPEFVAKRGEGFRIALLNLDVDLYAPTKVALNVFVPCMARGGIIILDEYAVDTFGGETKAVDNYFQEQFGKKPKVVKFAWHSNPTGFIEVDW
jgi:hypothetical protein